MDDITRRSILPALAVASVALASEANAANVKISAFPNASLPMGSGDTVTGLQGATNVNFSQAQILSGQNAPAMSGMAGANITLQSGDGDGVGVDGNVYLKGGTGGASGGGYVFLQPNGQTGSYGLRITGNSGNTYLKNKGFLSLHPDTGFPAKITTTGGGYVVMQVGSLNNYDGIHAYFGAGHPPNGGGGYIISGAADGSSNGNGGYFLFQTGPGQGMGVGGNLTFQTLLGGGASAGNMTFDTGMGGNTYFKGIPTSDPSVTDGVFFNNNVMMKSGVTNANGTYTIVGIGAKTITIVNGIITSIA